MGKIWPKIITEDNINEAPLTWSVSPRKNRMTKIKNDASACDKSPWFRGVETPPNHGDLSQAEAPNDIQI